MNIVMAYETSGLKIAETIKNELLVTNTNWSIKEFPLLNNDRNSFFQSLKTFEIETDVVIFICTKKFLIENESYIKILRKISNSTKYRFIWLLVDSNYKELPPNIPTDVAIKIKEDNAEVEELIKYLKIIEIAVHRNKEKELKTRKQRHFMFLFVSGYMIIILCAVLVILFGESRLYKTSAELTLTLISMVTTICIVILISIYFYSIKRKEEQEEKKKFSEELDESLSSNKNISTSVKLTNVLMDLIDKTNNSFFNISPATLSIEAIGSILHLVSSDDKTDGSTFDEIDTEIARALGEEEYLPLGHLKFNWKQMKGYYDISKKQATTSFRWAIGICFLGIAIIVFAIVSPFFQMFKDYNSLVPILGSIGGAVVEVFAGTILLVYKKSLSQMNLYHKALSEYQRYLSCVNLVSRISDVDKQNTLLEEIIREEIKKNEVIIDNDLLEVLKKNNAKVK